ncbi:hypothetical protein BJ875DRAFT_544811 [Amylocarpus encephaloides]|uniref:Cyanovirin-N domain-containing protein n=1 Tax=Amylocarpus encephaloides TaxID=45428 RepID=A0A9P8C3I9_9HELO|nr:hypothetical protein BJ875DRAFT_544811 [Amylocarpus encephaloides]
MKIALIVPVLAVLLGTVIAEREGCNFQIVTQSRTAGQDENGIVLENKDQKLTRAGRFYCDESVTVDTVQKFKLQCDGTLWWVRQDLGTGSYFGTCPSEESAGVRNIMMNAGKRSQCAANTKSERTRLRVSKLCLASTICPLKGPMPVIAGEL